MRNQTRATWLARTVKESDVITYVLMHNHECSRKGEKYYYRPEVDDGVAFVTIPTCIETGSDLQVMERVQD